MKTPLISIVIPYKNRLDNLALALEALSHQDFGKDNFEVVVGALEYCAEYVALCKKFENTLNIRSVLASDSWQVALARNLAIRQASGEILVFLDVDMAVADNFARNLYEKHFSNGQEQCVIGQMIDYDNNNSDVESVKVKPYSYYAGQLADLQNQSPFIMDERWKVDSHIPWALVWTALVALPRHLVVKHHLQFDLNFHGYGVEDLEWALRIHKAGIPIVLKEDVWGIHLPHVRNLGTNKNAEKKNYQYFLKKWPANEVEIVSAFGDFEGNTLWEGFKKELTEKLPQTTRYSVVNRHKDGKNTLYIGALLDEENRVMNIDEIHNDTESPDVLPILGLRLPFDDKTIDACYLLPELAGISERFKQRVQDESHRVAKEVIQL